MNISELKPRIYGYLGFKGAVASPQTDALIAECLTELDEQNEFRVTYKIFTERSFNNVLINGMYLIM